MAQCSSNEPGIVFSELAISTFHINGIDSFTADCVCKYRSDSFGCSINNGVFYLQQTPFFIPLFLCLNVFQIRKREPFGMRAAASSGVRHLVIEAIVGKQSLLIKPVIRSKQGRFSSTVRLYLAHKPGRFLQVPLCTVYRMGLCFMNISSLAKAYSGC